jgi:hypothetical protein
LKSKFSTARSQIAIIIVVAFEVSINRAHKGIEPDIKLSFIDQQGVVNILLNNACPLFIAS